MQIVKYAFQQHGDDRGMLVALEEYNDIPFEIKRVYYMYDTKEGVTRGYHVSTYYSERTVPHMVFPETQSSSLSRYPDESYRNHGCRSISVSGIYAHGTRG